MANGKPLKFQFYLDDLGHCFVKKCIEIVENRGLDDQGLYRIGGVNSRVTRLLQMCLDRKNYNQTTGQVNMPDFSDPVEWETKTITSALKNYLRNLSEPLMTYNLHPAVIDAAKIENPQSRTDKIKNLIQQLPVRNFNLLKILVEHLKNVANLSQKNLMTVSNLGICFAPTLMRGPDENALSIMEIKYSNVVTNTLIEAYDLIFNDPLLNQPQQPYQSLPQPIRYTNNHIVNNYDNQFGLYNDPRMTQPPQQSYTSLPQPIRYTNTSFVDNYDDHFGLALPSQQQYQNNMLPVPYYSMNSLNEPQYRSDKVITLYACVADTESELSFGPNEVIVDVRNSAEVGWLIGTLERNGHRGLLPDNYVMFI